MSMSEILKTLVSVTVFLGVSACSTQKSPGTTSIQETLGRAEKDARSGNEEKAVKEIDEARKALIDEDKKAPVTQNFRSVSGEDVKAKAESDAIRELDHAKRDARSNLAGDSADEVKKAIQDVKLKQAQ